MRISIRKVIYSFGAAVAVGLLIAVAMSLWATNQIRVGGPTYTKIIQGKDLVADILPPPAYVIESYLEATLALNNAKPIAESSAALRELKKQYDERYEFWVKSDLADSMKIKMTKDSARACHGVLACRRTGIAAGAGAERPGGGRARLCRRHEVLCGASRCYRSSGQACRSCQCGSRKRVGAPRVQGARLGPQPRSRAVRHHRHRHDRHQPMGREAAQWSHRRHEAACSRQSAGCGSFPGAKRRSRAHGPRGRRVPRRRG